MKANIRVPDGKRRFAASHLELFYLPMSHENDARLIWVKVLAGNEKICLLHMRKQKRR